MTLFHVIFLSCAPFANTSLCSENDPGGRVALIPQSFRFGQPAGFEKEVQLHLCIDRNANGAQKRYLKPNCSSRMVRAAVILPNVAAWRASTAGARKFG